MFKIYLVSVFLTEGETECVYIGTTGKVILTKWHRHFVHISRILGIQLLGNVQHYFSKHTTVITTYSY